MHDEIMDADFVKQVQSVLGSLDLPPQEVPTIMICGQIGVGKTSTINTLFGEYVGNVGHDEVGTLVEQIVDWEHGNANIHVVDLPGLGDSPKREAEFQKLYRKWAEVAHGFIVVVSPPRPASIGMVNTVRILLENGVQSKDIIFGYNKLSHLRYRNDAGRDKNVQLDGARGPKDASDVQAIENACAKVLNALNGEFPTQKFKSDQVIPYDSDSGWNLNKLMGATIANFPYVALGGMRTQLKHAYEQLQKHAGNEDERKIIEAAGKDFERTWFAKAWSGLAEIIRDSDPELAGKMDRVKARIGLAAGRWNIIQRDIGDAFSTAERAVVGLVEKIWSDLV